MAKSNREKVLEQKIIGLLPAGGIAARLAPLPFSKELYPIGFRPVNQGHSFRPKVVCHYLLEKMRLADITKAYIVLREGKWDIPAYLGDGKMFDMHLAYLIMRLPFGVACTLDQAYPFVQDTIVAFGFPDIIFQTEDAFEQLLTRQANTNADIVLGVFSINQSQKWDMVDLDKNGRIKRIVTKSDQIHMHYTWAIAVWTPVFTHFMHKYLAAIQDVKEQHNAGNNVPEQPEFSVGGVMQAAITSNLRVQGVLFPDDTCTDIGTPDDLFKVIRSIT
jgi:glucose-1-phosphate thymidylyltransferase